MKYTKVGSEPGWSESISTFICAVILTVVLAVPATISGIAWAIFRWHFIRGMFLYADLDSVRAESDNETTELEKL